MAFITFIKNYQPFILGIVFVLIFTWENIIPQQRFHDLFKHNLKNFSFGAINLVISFGGGFYFSKYLDWCESKSIGILFHLSLHPVLKLAIVFLIADIIMYWWHRFNHTVSFLWRFHSFHHIDEKMNATTAVRFHVVELLLSFILRMMLYPLFGLTSIEIIVFSTIHFSMIIFHHSNIFMLSRVDKIVRLIITSPGMHRIHHSDKWEETNSNYTSILSCWDWIFGSYTKEPGAEIKFGLPQNNFGMKD